MTGLRRGEACALRWSDVDLAAGVLRVRRSLVLVDGRPTMTEPKSDASRRSVELDARTVAALRDHRRRQAEERLAWGPAYSGADLLFCREDGAAYRPDWVYRRFRRSAAEAGLPEIPLHGLRHSHATALLVAGTHPKVVQERLGHSAISITLDTYSAVIPTMQRAAADRLAALIDGAGADLPLTSR